MHVLSKHKTASGSWRLLVNGKVHPLLVGFDNPEAAVAKGTTLFPNGILVTIPDTDLEWPIITGPVTSPFLLPEIIQKPVSLTELIDKFKSIVNTGYMPLSNGTVRYNRKPEYVSEDQIRELSDGTGFYTLSNGGLKTIAFRFGKIPIEGHSIYAGIKVSPSVEILINLRIPFEHSFVRMRLIDGSFTEWLRWTSQELNIDREDLQKQLVENF